MRLENYKDRAKIILLRGFKSLKPFLSAILIIGFLQITGLISYASDFSNWALLQTGLKDAGVESADTEEVFDYQFTIKDMNGKRIQVSEFKGKVIFLNLWATWCGPCRAEMAGIEELYKKVDKSKIVFLMVSLDRDEDHDKIVAYMKKRAFTFAAYQPSGYVPPLLNVPSIPTTYIISKDGKVLRKEVGSIRYDTPKFQEYLTGLTR